MNPTSWKSIIRLINWELIHWKPRYVTFIIKIGMPKRSSTSFGMDSSSSTVTIHRILVLHLITAWHPMSPQLKPKCQHVITSWELTSWANNIKIRYVTSCYAQYCLAIVFLSGQVCLPCLGAFSPCKTPASNLKWKLLLGYWLSRTNQH